MKSMYSNGFSTFTGLPHDTCPSCRSPLVSDPERNHTQDQRAVARIRKSGYIRFYRDLAYKSVIGEIIDLSPDGMCFQCSAKLVPKMTIKISNPDLKAVAVIVHARKMIDRDRIFYIVGVSFLSVQFRHSKGNFHATYA